VQTQDNLIMANSSESNQAKPAQRTKQACGAEQVRQQRLSKALRENLFKRKKQIHSRQQQQTTTMNRADLKIKDTKN